LLVGLGTHRSHVVAVRPWGLPMERRPRPPARPGSWEAVRHRLGAGRAWPWLDDLTDSDAACAPRGHRALGMGDHPEREAEGNPMPTELPDL